MNQEPSYILDTLRHIVEQFGLQSLRPSLSACETLIGEKAFVDVAVVGQFKSGKSSLLNTLLGSDLFPVSALPATAVITRASAGPSLTVQVRHLDGQTYNISPEQIKDFVTEAGNPRNQRRVALVDVFTPAMSEWPGVRLVDTPGLGSVYQHNTEATRDWLPNLVVALVTISADRPLSDEDRRLIVEASRIAPRLVVILSKVDLLSQDDLVQVKTFLEAALRESLPATVPVLPFSTRQNPQHWIEQLRQTVFLPLAQDVAGTRREAVRLKLQTLVESCRGYLQVGLQSAERTEADRQQLCAAVLDESLNAAVIRDELLLVERRMSELIRPAFEELLFAHRDDLLQTILRALDAELPTWRGSLNTQKMRFEKWMAEQINALLLPLSEEAAGRAQELLAQAESRFRRVVEAFRDRLGHNVQQSVGITISPATWEVSPPHLKVLPVAVGRTFMLSWEMVSWIVPMSLFGGLFQQHLRHRVPWEVQKNLSRLVSDWCVATERALTPLRLSAVRWVETELATLDRLLRQQPPEVSAFREAMRRLEECKAE
jgi:GTP-binding protein EngB required for normal cell division